jgi:YVTN family beta-propeller protein
MSIFGSALSNVWDRGLSFFAAALMLVAAIAGSPAHAQTVAATVTVGNHPESIAANPTTNLIYAANSEDGTVSVINGATNAVTVTVTVGSDPVAIAVNSATNTIYVVNASSNNVTVINGSTNATTTVAAGNSPDAVAINSVTNTIYVTNNLDNTVTVINGSSNATSSLAVGELPVNVAVNSATNKVYVVNVGGGPSVGGQNDGTVTVINGSSNTVTATVNVGAGPDPIAVNTVTNMVYIDNTSDGTVSVINGSSNAVSSVAAPAGFVPAELSAIAVNPVTNTVYVVNNTSPTVTVIGASNSTSTVSVGNNPVDIGVDTVTDQIYIGNDTDSSVTVINGATNATTTVAAGSGPIAVAVDETTHMAYVANAEGRSVTVIAGSSSGSTPTPTPTPTPTGGGGASGSARLINISTRAGVGTGGNILIPGFVIGGTGTETLLIRADGPALTGFGVAGALAQPSLSVFNSAGTVVASNTGWGTNTNPAQIASAATSVGAFALASGSADCALIASLPSGAYTVQISGVGNTTGVALAEVYEVSASGTRLVNISTRAEVGTGPNIIIPGFVIAGSGSDQLLARGDGPALTAFGVGGALAQPSLSVFDSSGNVIASNTGWGTNSNAAQIASAAAQVGAFALASGSADSALIVNVSAGAYTMQISGVNNSTGVALAEVYEVP